MTAEELKRAGTNIVRGLMDGTLRVVDVAPASDGQTTVTFRLSEEIEETLAELVRS